MPIILTRPFKDTALPVGTYRNIINSYDPIAYWYMDELSAINDLTDSSGNGYHGDRISGNAGQVSPLPYGTARENLRVNITEGGLGGAGLDTAMQGKSLTFIGWVRMSVFAIAGSSWDMFFSSVEGTTSIIRRIHIRCNGANNFEVVTSSVVGAQTFTTHPDVLVANVWYHIAVTFNYDDGKITIYKDGVDGGNYNFAGHWKGLTSSSRMTFGFRWTSATGQTDILEGQMDEMAWLPVALNDAEVLNAYNNRYTV